METNQYGNRIGYYERERCTNCEWEGFRSELESFVVYDDESEDCDPVVIDKHWACPNCKTIIIE